MMDEKSSRRGSLQMVTSERQIFFENDLTSIRANNDRLGTCKFFKKNFTEIRELATLE